MKDTTKISLGIILTILIYAIAQLISLIIRIPIEFIPSTFLVHTTMLILSGIFIYYFQSRKLLNFKIKRIKFKLFFRVILTSIIAFIIVAVISNILFKIFHIPSEKANPFLKFTPLQMFVFVLIYASIAEEMLFRGLLLNMLEPLRNNGIKIMKTNISVPVIISGVLFGLAHFILLKTDAGIPFVIRTVFLTTTIGIIASYFQEKYENNTLVAIIAHMTVNALGLLGLMLTLSMSK
jgi:membrane protease YdiL (CAAX protease family)